MLSKEDKKFLELYSDSIYEKPSVTVDAVIFRLYDKPQQNYRKLPEKKLQVYLTKRQFSPYKGKYSIVGTFIDLNHELNESMQCCVEKKVGLKNNYYYEQLFTFGNKNRDPRNRVLSVSYMLLTNQDTVVSGGEWFDIDIKVRREKGRTEKTYDKQQRIFDELVRAEETVAGKETPPVNQFERITEDCPFIVRRAPLVR